MKHPKHRHPKTDYTGERDPLAQLGIGKPWWDNLGGYQPSKATGKNKKYSGQFRGGKR